MTSNEVHFAQSLEEMRAIEARYEACSLKQRLARLSIAVWVIAANSLVAVLRSWLFRRGIASREQVRDIVAYTAGTLGDNAVTLSALAALRDGFPEATLTVITNTTGFDPELVKSLFAEVRWLNRVVACCDDPVKRQGLRLRVTFPIGEKFPCDLFVNFSRFGNTGWLGAVLRELMFAKWLGAKWVIGFRINAYNRRGSVLNKVKHYFVHNEPRRGAEVLKEIMLVPGGVANALPSSAQALDNVLAKLGARAGQSIFVLNPGAKFKIQCWPPARFAELAAHLRKEYNAWVVITGTASERLIGDEIIRMAGDVGINLAGQTSVQELIELLRLSVACISNDTGTMHIAAELGIPTVAIFTTRMSPTAWFPKGGSVIAVFSFSGQSYSYSDEGEAPCECLMQIQVKDVLLALRKLLPQKVGSDEKSDVALIRRPGIDPGILISP